MTSLKKYFLLFTVLLVVAVVSYKHFVRKDSYRYKIALLLPALHPALEEISESLKNTITKISKEDYQVDTFNANGNKNALRAQAEEILIGNYDAILPIGTLATQTIYELTQKKGIQTPIIFMAVDDPVALRIVDSLEKPGGTVTGVTDQQLYEQQLALLLEIKPSTKKIVLVYDPSYGPQLEKGRMQVEQFCQRYTIGLQVIQINNANEITYKVSPFVEDADVILIFADHTAVTGLPALVNIANKYKVTLYASDLNSADNGAALAFGIVQGDYGKEAALLLKDILEGGKKASEVPITTIVQQRLKVNVKAAAQQGLVISPHILQLLAQKEALIGEAGQ